MALAAVLLLGSWIGVERRDDGWLVLLGGRAVDPKGVVASGWTRVWRDCRAVRDLAPDEPGYRRSVQALRAFSPPDSASARVLRMQALGPWRALQATFDRLEPVVVLVLDEGAGEGAAERAAGVAAGVAAGRAAAVEMPTVRVLDSAVWSGTTRPWDPAWRIRGFLATRVPDVPRALIECLDPEPVF